MISQFKGKCRECGHDHGEGWQKSFPNAKTKSKLQSLINELYALRGEDEEIARICKALEEEIRWIE